MGNHHIAPGGRYPILRTIAILWLVAGILALVGGVFQAVIELLGMQIGLVNIGGLQWSGRIMAFFIWLAATFFVVIFNVAVAELIKLAIDVEHNSRMIARNTMPAGAAAGRIDNGKGDLEEESAEAALIRGH